MLSQTAKSNRASWLHSPAIWAAQTYATAALPDQRLNARLVQTAALLAARPSDSIPQAGETWAQSKGIYRMIENDSVSAEQLLQPVYEATAKRCAGAPVILAVQDTTSLNYTSLRQTEGLGPIDSGQARGLLLHSTLAVRADGVPLGVLHAQSWARAAEGERSAPQRKQRPIEEKESAKWLRGMSGAQAVLQRCVPAASRPRLIHIQDREGDIHEVLQAVVEAGEGCVIRCEHNRRVQGPEESIAYAHEQVRQAPVLGRLQLAVPRKPGQVQRTAEVELRSLAMTLSPCRQRHPNRRPLRLTLVEVWESDPPPDVQPLHWLLWTTEPAATREQVLTVVQWYRQRWQIEEVHLALKSGCRIESLQFDTAERLRKALAIYLPIAVRIVQLRSLARVEPESPCTTVLSEDEWRTLWISIHRKRPPANTRPPTLRQAVLWIGRLGGHLGRKGDGMPGVRTLWRGWRDLQVRLVIYQARA